jgi:ribosome-binding protein aMBF1 (putative translation factor)
MPKTRDFAKVIAHQLAGDRKLRAAVEKERLNAAIAELILAERTNAKLTQRQLADAVGTKQPVIARLEDADYDGHSLTMLWRIADALGKRLELRFTDAEREPSAGRTDSMSAPSPSKPRKRSKRS